jgi:hypothetical protein
MNSERAAIQATKNPTILHGTWNKQCEKHNY